MGAIDITASAAANQRQAPLSMPRPLLVLEGIEKRFGGAQVLHGIDLTINDGEFLTVLGASGSGKTTVLRLIGGFTEPSAGRILFEGADIVSVPAYRRPVNTVFQDYALFPHLTVAGNVAYGLEARGTARDVMRPKVAEALERVALKGFDARYPSQLSGGQRQRVALARALVLEPRLILLDEPLGALDAALRRQMLVFLKQLQREIRTTFLLVTHDQEEAIVMSDRICVLDAGRIAQIGTPHELYYRPASEYIARFFGDNNLIEGRLGPSAAAVRFVETAAGRLMVSTKDQSDVAEAPTGTPVKIALRPEAIQVAPGSEFENHLSGTIRDVTFAGAISQIVIQPSGETARPLTIKLASRAAGLGLSRGQPITAGWSSADCRILLR